MSTLNVKGFRKKDSTHGQENFSRHKKTLIEKIENTSTAMKNAFGKLVIYFFLIYLFLLERQGFTQRRSERILSHLLVHFPNVSELS